jgi:hypothetical protein
MFAKLAPLLLTFPFLGLTLTGCAPQSTITSTPQSSFATTRQILIASLNQCSQSYGYDPNNVSGLSEHAIAPGELQWRQCTYDAIRAYEKSNPALASLYEQLISEDIEMTIAIQQRALTRSQRRARIDALIAQVKAAEEVEMNRHTNEQAQQWEQVRQVVNGLR